MIADKGFLRSTDKWHYYVAEPNGSLTSGGEFLANYVRSVTAG